MGRIDLPRREIVVGVVERASVGVHWLCTQYRVVHDTLHAVPVAGVAGYSQEVSGEFEVRIGAARCFERVVCRGQTSIELSAVGSNELLAGTPASCRIALCGQHVEGVPGRAQMFLASLNVRYACMAELRELT